MIEKEKSLVPIDLILEGYKPLMYVKRSKGPRGNAKIEYYFPVLGKWVRGLYEVRHHLESNYSEYGRILKLKEYLINNSSKSFSLRDCAKDLRTTRPTIINTIIKYSGEHFYNCCNDPIFNLEIIKELILDNYYSNANLEQYPNTRYYLYKDLSKNIFSRLGRGVLVKEDFVSNVEKRYPYLRFDFSTVPEILSSTNEYVTLYCGARNPYNLEEVIGDYHTCYDKLIKVGAKPSSIGNYIKNHSIKEYVDLIHEYENRIGIGTERYLPSPYQYKIYVKRYYHPKTFENMWFDPIRGIFRTKSELLIAISKYGQTFLDWENRWYLELKEEDLYTESWINKKIEFLYNDKSDITKNYIKNKLSENPSFEFDGFICKDEFTYLYNETKSKRCVDVEYSFDLVPEIIKSRYQKLTLLYKFNDEIKSAKIKYLNLIERLQDVRDFRSAKISKMLSITEEEFFNTAIKLHGYHFDFTNTVFVDLNTPVLVRCKICGKESYVKPKNLLNKGYAGCCINSSMFSLGETYTINWLDNHTDLISSYEYHYDVPNKQIEGRNTYRVNIDFRFYINSTEYYIEYNGPQHYRYVSFFQDSLEDYEKQLKRDRNVREFCKANDISLIEIPYTYDSIEKVAEILDRIFINKEPIEDVIVSPEIAIIEEI